MAMLTLTIIIWASLSFMAQDVRCGSCCESARTVPELITKHRRSLEVYRDIERTVGLRCLPMGPKRRFEGVYTSVFEGGDELFMLAPGTMTFTGERYGTGPLPGRMLDFGLSLGGDSLFERLPLKDQVGKDGTSGGPYHLKFTGWHLQYGTLDGGTRLVDDMIFVDQVESVRVFDFRKCEKNPDCRKSAGKYGYWYFGLVESQTR